MEFDSSFEYERFLDHTTRVGASWEDISLADCGMHAPIYNGCFKIVMDDDNNFCPIKTLALMLYNNWRECLEDGSAKGFDLKIKLALSVVMIHRDFSLLKKAGVEKFVNYSCVHHWSDHRTRANHLGYSVNECLNIAETYLNHVYRLNDSTVAEFAREWNTVLQLAVVYHKETPFAPFTTLALSDTHPKEQDVACKFVELTGIKNLPKLAEKKCGNLMGHLLVPAKCMVAALVHPSSPMLKYGTRGTLSTVSEIPSAFCYDYLLEEFKVIGEMVTSMVEGMITSLVKRGEFAAEDADNILHWVHDSEANGCCFTVNELMDFGCYSAWLLLVHCAEDWGQYTWDRPPDIGFHDVIKFGIRYRLVALVLNKYGRFVLTRRISDEPLLPGIIRWNEEVSGQVAGALAEAVIPDRQAEDHFIYGA